MTRERGVTLLELITYLSLSATALFAGYSLYGAERLAHGRQARVFEDSQAISEALHALAADLRLAKRVAPREHGPGAVLLLPGGGAIVWFDRPGRPGEIWRKVVRADGTADAPVRVRGIDGLTVATDDPLFTATARAGGEARSLTVRRRVP